MRTTARQTRENRTITVDFQHEATYLQLLGDGKAFLACVLAFLLSLGLQLAGQTPPTHVLHQWSLNWTGFLGPL